MRSGFHVRRSPVRPTPIFVPDVASSSGALLFHEALTRASNGAPNLEVVRSAVTIYKAVQRSAARVQGRVTRRTRSSALRFGHRVDLINHRVIAQSENFTVNLQVLDVLQDDLTLGVETINRFDDRRGRCAPGCCTCRVGAPGLVEVMATGFERQQGFIDALAGTTQRCRHLSEHLVLQIGERRRARPHPGSLPEPLEGRVLYAAFSELLDESLHVVRHT